MTPLASEFGRWRFRANSRQTVRRTTERRNYFCAFLAFFCGRNPSVFIRTCISQNVRGRRGNSIERRSAAFGLCLYHILYRTFAIPAFSRGETPVVFSLKSVSIRVYPWSPSPRRCLSLADDSHQILDLIVDVPGFGYCLGNLFTQDFAITLTKPVRYGFYIAGA